MEIETTPSAEPDAAAETGAPREQAVRMVLPPFDPGSLRPLYVSPRGLTRALAIALVVATLSAWVALGVHLAHLRALHVQLAGAGDAQQLAKITAALRIAQGAQIAVFALTGLLFLVWLYRLRVNVRALGVRKLVYGRRWSVIGFLVPILNIVRPYQVMAEVWRASDPAVVDPFEWKTLEPPPILALWWASFAIAATLGLAAVGFGFTAGVPAFESVVASSVAIIADLLAAVSASIAYFMVNQLCAAQMAKRERLRTEALYA